MAKVKLFVVAQRKQGEQVGFARLDRVILFFR
jgi:hypothetical protein